MVIVAAVDRSNRTATVVDEAEMLARQFEEPVHVVHVLSDSEYYDLQRTNVEKRGKGIEMDDVKSVAADIATEAAGDIQVSWEAVGLVGDASERVVSYAVEHDARYVVVGPKKQSPTGKALFGSVAQQILLKSPIPVVATTVD